MEAQGPSDLVHLALQEIRASMARNIQAATVEQIPDAGGEIDFLIQR
jgi:hypothetical protein